jgi:hypothetical protein
MNNAEQARALHQALLLDGVGAPWHALSRLAALVGTEIVEHTDGSIDGAPESRSGRVVVFTETRVLLATLTSARESDGNGLPPEISSVEVRTWRRSEASTLSVSDSDLAWHREWQDRWPKDTSVTIQFPGRDALQLPLSPYPTDHTRTRLVSFLPSILDDVGKG